MPPVGMLSNVQAMVARRQSRKSRTPQHQWHLRTQPFAIVPFLAAPVLPGDTMRHFLHQSRVVSEPVANPLIGWWKEYFYFYVSFSAMARGNATFAENLKNMLLDPTTSLADNATNKNQADFIGSYAADGGVRYSNVATDACIQEYFRDQDEALGAVSIDNYYAAQFVDIKWLDSVISKTDFEAQMPPNIPVVDTADANATLDAHEVAAAMRHYEMLRTLRLTDATYEDVLAAYGVSVPSKLDTPVPELIRHLRRWTYPNNTVDPTTGTPTTAMVWSIEDRADKDRFFKEPGIILGLTVARPKVYFSKLQGAAVGLLDNAKDWINPLLGDDPYATIKEMAAAGANGPIETTTDGYYVDVADLFLYGDEWKNFALSTTGKNLFANPTVALGKKYPSQADVDALFKNAAGGFKYLWEDGVCNFTIASRVVDRTSKV